MIEAQNKRIEQEFLSEKIVIDSIEFLKTIIAIYNNAREEGRQIEGFRVEDKYIAINMLRSFDSAINRLYAAKTLEHSKAAIKVISDLAQYIKINPSYFDKAIDFVKKDIINNL